MKRHSLLCQSRQHKNPCRHAYFNQQINRLILNKILRWSDSAGATNLGFAVVGLSGSQCLLPGPRTLPPPCVDEPALLL